jgi:hypothetical protein
MEQRRCAGSSEPTTTTASCCCCCRPLIGLLSPFCWRVGVQVSRIRFLRCPLWRPLMPATSRPPPSCAPPPPGPVARPTYHVLFDAPLTSVWWAGSGNVFVPMDREGLRFFVDGFQYAQCQRWRVCSPAAMLPCPHTWPPALSPRTNCANGMKVVVQTLDEVPGPGRCGPALDIALIFLFARG